MDSCVVFWIFTVSLPYGIFGYYDGESLGVDKWHTKYPDCGGLMQSPVDIQSKDVIYDHILEPFDMTKYQSESSMKVINKEKHSLTLMYEGEGSNLLNITQTDGGSLPDIYTLLQVHFHWGQADHHGSEHTVDGVGYPMEMHIVHRLWHQDKSTANEHPFGLAVIGYFLEFGAHNGAFEDLITELDKIGGPKEEGSIPFANIRKLLPAEDKHHYHRYFGSLTTPPCSETVIWSVATKHIPISKDQLGQFKTFLEKMNQTMSGNNYRPVQKINYRHVFSSDPHYRSLGADCENNGGVALSTTLSLWSAVVSLTVAAVLALL